MNTANIILLFLCIIPAVSYGWGMRGTTIGGEKGAMLPGALIGFLLAHFSGVLIVQEHFYIFSALGAVAMYLGGSMSYGETLSFSMSSRPAENMKKGLIALFLKGFLWFGSFGCVFSTGVNAVSRFYKPQELAIIFAVTPTIAFLSYWLLNKPMKPLENRFPYFYFSKTRQESWGSLLGVMVPLILLGIIKRDLFSTLFPLICALFGGIGWVLGQLSQIYIIHYSDSSKIKLIRKLKDKNCLESWKSMECVLGAFGGLGAVIGFTVTYNSFKANVFALEKNGGLLPYSEKASEILFVIWLVLLALDMIHYFIKKPATKEELKNKLKNGEITKEVYSVKLTKAVDEIPVIFNIYKKSLEPVEFLLYSVIPFLMICLGSTKAAVAMTFFIMFLVIAQEIALESKLPFIYSVVLGIMFTIIGAVLLVLQLGCDVVFSSTAVILLYTAIYELLTLLWLVPEILINSRNSPTDAQIGTNVKALVLNSIRSNKSTIIVHGYFILCIIFVLIMTI